MKKTSSFKNIFTMVTNRKLILMLLFITCSIYAMAQADYYYYRGKKIPLILNENKVVVSTPKDCKETYERVLANVQVLSMIKDDDLDIFVIPRSDYDNLTKLDSWTEDAKNVILTFCYCTEDNADVIATPYLNVELKKEEDIELLNSYAEKYKLRFGTWQSMFFPLLYNLAITPESNMNSVECANRLYESGDFESSAPDLWSVSNETTVRNITIATTRKILCVYDLSGRKVQGTPKKGVYIQGGKKVVIK